MEPAHCGLGHRRADDQRSRARGAEHGAAAAQAQGRDPSFFATLECELLDRRSWPTKTEARMALFTYIEGWYNPRRRHSALGQMSPANFESKHLDNNRSGEHGLPTVGVCVAGATPPVDNPAPELIVST